MSLPYEEYKFESLKLIYNQQIENLRYITHIDLRVFSGYITLQLILGGWLIRPAQSEVGLNIMMKIGLLFIDLTLAVIAAKLLRNSSLRRKEVIKTIHNINEALGYEKEDVYLPGKALNAPTQTRLWFPWYLSGIIAAAIGVFIIVFSI